MSSDPEFSVRLIRLANGTLIDPKTREPISTNLHPQDKKREPEPEPEPEIERLNVVATERRSIMDLKLNKNQMAFINNVLVYTLYGLPPDEIAMQCSCTEDDIRIVRDLDEYKQMYDAMTDALRAAYEQSVQGILISAAPAAAKKIVRKMSDKSSDISLAAIKDVLDRSGHRPADRVEHVHSLADGELRIRIVKATDRDHMPTIDLKPNA